MFRARPTIDLMRSRALSLPTRFSAQIADISSAPTPQTLRVYRLKYASWTALPKWARTQSSKERGRGPLAPQSRDASKNAFDKNAALAMLLRSSGG
ncbi:MAG: hypothetical protein A2506_05620 [Elusimicrobia bacterium RIFOXYD12_FULL_66_9]|nr:MAG: hypothetical protein A2506_05620 [Elusimicrobia bacterium RIFOXYD12_FULL_66_9]